jgi:uncharacterized protein (DUF1697 family)
MRFAAFLRAVNVGGTNQIKMADLRKKLEIEGISSETYLASGNLFLDAPNEAVARSALAKALRALAKRDVAFVLRCIQEIRDIVSSDPFAGSDTSDEKRLVTFTAEPIDIATRLPLTSPRGDLTMISARDREVFSLYRKLDDKHVLPSDFIERYVGRWATTRSWETVLGLLEKETEWKR